MHIKYVPLCFVGVILSFTRFVNSAICAIIIVMLTIAFFMFVKPSHSKDKLYYQHLHVPVIMSISPNVFRAFVCILCSTLRWKLAMCIVGFHSFLFELLCQIGVPV